MAARHREQARPHRQDGRRCEAEAHPVARDDRLKRQGFRTGSVEHARQGAWAQGQLGDRRGEVVDMDRPQAAVIADEADRHGQRRERAEQGVARAAPPDHDGRPDHRPARDPAFAAELGQVLFGRGLARPVGVGAEPRAARGDEDDAPDTGGRAGGEETLVAASWTAA